MEEYHRHCDEVGFNAEEAHNIVKECVDGVLGGEDYNHNNINQWTASIVEQSLTHLVKLGKAYKYIVTCAVVQKSAYGFHTASSCFWDTTSDGTCTVRWENRTMNCGVLLCRPGWSAVVQFRLTATSASQVQVILLPQPPGYLELQAHAITPG
ncbi:DYNLT3 isoform 2 [Pan troglodytes]|uniref:Dynein light chain Tctex-type 3 n=2 Tax=Pan troglodytes TaxID=9598 RepID=A0A6D2XDV8_PANTR|nr:DYNLT3 isoform 2 [Pan troglodytes]